MWCKRENVAVSFLHKINNAQYYLCPWNLLLSQECLKNSYCLTWYQSCLKFRSWIICFFFWSTDLQYQKIKVVAILAIFDWLICLINQSNFDCQIKLFPVNQPIKVMTTSDPSQNGGCQWMVETYNDDPLYL